MFEDMTVIHEGMLPRRGVIEGNQKFGLVLDQNHVLPPRACDDVVSHKKAVRILGAPLGTGQ